MVLHVAVIGAGPIGLEMAAGAVRRGFRVTVFERGAQIAANVRSWGHVALFSSNELNLSAHGSALLREAGVVLPAADVFPTGAQYVAEYLEPLAAALRASDRLEIRCGCAVVAVGRGVLTKGQAIGACEARSAAPFEMLVLEEGREHLVGGIDALVDASGTYGNPNWLGRGGRPALGERALRAAGAIQYTLPSDGAGADALLRGGTVAVIGSGASAITTLAMLRAKSAASGAALSVVWVTRRAGPPYALIDGDPLPQRAALHQLGNELAATSGAPGTPVATTGMCVDHRGGWQVAGLAQGAGDEEGITLQLEQSAGGAKDTVTVRHVIAHVGYRPETSLTDELQVHYCYASEGPMKLAAAMMAAGGGGGDCLAQVSPGPATMLNPEPGFFVVGMKSYGRGSAFLLKIGHEQCEHVLSLLDSHVA